jgi:predicted transposase YbfD/YdcC
MVATAYLLPFAGATRDVSVVTWPVHLLAVMDHTTRTILAQTDVDHTTGEIARFRPLLDQLDLTNTVITADALHTHREHADWLVTHKHAAYLLMVKANQPTLHQQLRRLPWREVPVADHTRDRGHGRVELRRLQVTTVAGLDFPHATQAPCGSPDGSGPAQPPLAVRDGVRGHQPHRHPGQLRPPGRLRARPLGHRGAAPHPRCHCRRGRLPDPRAGTAPRAMASLRNLAIGVLRLRGHRNIAAALRRNARDPIRLLPLLGITCP